MPENLYQVKAEPDWVGQRVDRFLVSREDFPLSRAHLQKLFKEGRVLRETGDRIKASEKLREGDSLIIRIPEPTGLEVEPVAMNLRILFEDEHLLVLEKPSGLVVHPGAGLGDEATLVHGLLAHCEGQLSGIGGVERPGIVHRLDRETSGLMVVAKTDPAHRGLVEAFAERHVRKWYTCLVKGSLKQELGECDGPIGRHPRERYRMTVRADGRTALTRWACIEQAKDYAWVLCRIYSGRTHQIRVHLARAGYPLLGDTLYGFTNPGNRIQPVPPRVMLHAVRLSFEHPIRGSVLDLTTPPPDDFHPFMGGGFLESPQWRNAYSKLESLA